MYEYSTSFVSPYIERRTFLLLFFGTDESLLARFLSFKGETFFLMFALRKTVKSLSRPNLKSKWMDSLPIVEQTRRCPSINFLKKGRDKANIV